MSSVAAAAGASQQIRGTSSPSPSAAAAAATAAATSSMGLGPPHKKKRTFKIIVIGDSGVGKTCLTFRFCSGHFPGMTEATIGVDFREKIVKVGGEEIRLQLWDTAGQERFRKSMVSHYYRNVSAVILVYDVSRAATFNDLPHWISECDSHGLLDRVPMVMVGNKCEDGMEAQVNTNTAQRYADDHRMPLFETSAKDDAKADHVEAIFMTIAHKLKQHNKALLSSAAAAAANEEHKQPIRLVYRNENYTGQNTFCCF